MSQKNESTKGDDSISDIQNLISQIMNQFHSQDQIFDQLFETNKQVKSNLDRLNQKFDTLLNMEEDSNDNQINDSNKIDNGTFNMENKTITYKNQTYIYDNEYVYENDSINILIDHFNQIKDTCNFPQGVDYCEKFFNEPRESSNKIILFNSSTPIQNTWFYFTLSNIKQLSCTQGWRVSGKKLFAKQTAQLKEYRNDIYPQGYEYCQFILNDQFRKNGSVHIIARNNGSVWTRYYFKSRMVKILPNEQLFLITGKNKLKDTIKSVERNKKDDLYPQGAEFCQNLLKNQSEINGQVMVIGGDSPDGRYMWYYLPPEQFELVCNTEWWYKGKESLDAQIRFIDERSRQPQSVYVQGKEYCKNLIKEQRDNGGAIHLLVRNSENNYWFCFKA